MACYQHLITGAKSETPDDFLGGILADDMGLGKTLSALATVLASEGHAAEFGALGASQSCTTSQATVVVVPSELLLNTWAEEINQHFHPGTIQWLKYHGQGRRNDDYRLGQYQIILTTYGTVMAECRRGGSALHRIQWYRLILDEAHTIRNCSSKQFKALNSIQSHIRWCLTGTQIQNSLEDLGSLIRFLGMPLFSDPATFRKYVAMVRLRKGSDIAEFENLRRILSSICLRRNRSILPSKGYSNEDRRVTLTAEEYGQYQTLEQACKRAIQLAQKRHGDDKVHHHRVLGALLRLRMFCNNGLDPRGTIIPWETSSHPDEVLRFFQQSGEAIIVFSFWKTSLDIVGNAMTDHKIHHLRVDGSIPAKKRNSILLEFQNESKWRVLLMTFSTGATGLNGLTVANRVHLLEPQWNPAAENQAIGRLLRLNQQRKVTIIRYVVEKTIEETVETKKLRKERLAGGGFLAKDSEEQKELRAKHWERMLEYVNAD
ncbi:SNF2 family N-terminal domain-containing protein [Chaetomidium leptoderma]|uniref:SNF2 family N-terminal domain-containing protein n=1 Tax=Chaetomidium leptoderma TaxID=669021 RepID=A0AAN6VW44_9PEZI|nr:SNF2 family N-terminal domain-containing protein [Chaetomidium leptoderma]